MRYSITNSDVYIESNLLGFYNILEACRHSYDGGAPGVEHLVYASSSSVYGGNTKVPFSTDDKVDHPVSLYAATKKSNELLAHCYAKLYNIPCTGLRFFTVYGPAGRPDMAYFGFTNKLLAGKTIQIFNHGHFRDKNHWDKDAAKKLLERGFSRNYYWSGREWPYKNVKPRILAEEMVDMNPVNYKWICLKGEPEVLCMCMDRQKGDLTFNYYDMNFNLLPFEWVHPNIKTGGVKRPENFDEMKKLTQKLSKGIPEVWVDFYDINGQVYFGELTFYHQSGFAPFSPEEWDLKLGQLLDLTDIKRE